MRYFLSISLLFTLLGSCTEPYIPELKNNTGARTLVVEGYINARGNSEYSLGYIAPLYEAADSTHTQVVNAEIAIEEENGTIFKDFSYQGNSRYVIRHGALNPDSRYRLRIKAGNREYLSEYVPVLISPEIEDLFWKQNTEEGVRFYVSTHGDDTGYYRWDFEESWTFKVPNISVFLFDGTRVRERSPEEFYPFFCYVTEKSREIVMYTTETQTENIVKDLNVHFIPNFSEKLGMKYSILVRQYAMTKEAFGYWSLVKKNSEEIGDLFGTLPTELTGNITCISHPGEKVVGMIEAGKITEQRIFVNHNDFPLHWAYRYIYYGRCVITPANMVHKRDANAFFAANPDLVPVDEASPTGDAQLTHYSYSNAPCLDCSYRGSKEPPAFWVNQ